jgi:hypothetical protein
MTNLLTIVLTTVQWFVANIVAYELFAATFDSALFLFAEALDLYIDIALLAGSLMACVLTLVLQAVKKLSTGVLTAELTSGGN